MELSGLTSLVTGASRRIGRSIALTLATAGSDVAIHYHQSGQEAEVLAREIRSMGRKAWVSHHDLSDSGATTGWFSTLYAEIGGVDILVNSASEYPEDRYADLDARKLSRSMAINLLSPVAMARAMYRGDRPGTVVNILDTRAVDRDTNHVSYHLGKKALHTATKELAVEMAPQIRVNAVAPGIILPPDGEDDSWLQRLKKTNPLLDHGNPEDVAAAVLYLTQARFVTGQTIFVDGGRHLKGS